VLQTSASEYLLETVVQGDDRHLVKTQATVFAEVHNPKILFQMALVFVIQKAKLVTMYVLSSMKYKPRVKQTWLS